MFDTPMIREILEQMLTAIKRIEPDKTTEGKLLPLHPEIDWKGVMGMRDIMSHRYFSINAELVYAACKKKVPSVKETLAVILQELP